MKWDKYEYKLISNKVRMIRQDKLELDNLLPILEEKKRDLGLNKYLDKNFRTQILNKAETLGYSKSEITRMTTYIDNWNQDIVTIDIIEDFECVEKYVKEYGKKYEKNNKKHILYRIGNLGKDGGIVNGN